ncbi:protein ligase RNF213 (Partial), partial [Seminavis robusta]
PLIAAGSKGTSLAKVTTDALCDCLDKDLACYKESLVDDVIELLRDEAWRDLLQGRALWIVLHFVRATVQERSASFGEKLGLLATVHRELASGRHSAFKDDQICEKWVKEHLVKALNGHRCAEKLSQSSRVALQSKNPFASESWASSDFPSHVANCIVASLQGPELVRNIRTIKGVIESLATSVEKTQFQSSLERSLREAIVNECSSIETASSVLLQLVFTRDSTFISEGLGDRVFKDSFEAWKPSSLDTFRLDSPSVVDFCSACLDLGDGEPTMRPFREVLFRLFFDWLDLYETEGIPLEDLKNGPRYSKTRLWEVVQRKLFSQLPSTSSIELKIQEFEGLLASTKSSLSEPSTWNCSLPDLLNAYNCSISPESESGRIILSYCTGFGDEATESFGNATTETAHTLSQLREDASCAESIRSAFWPSLSTCSFFLQNKSAIFERAFGAHWEGNGDLDRLKESVKAALSEVKALFGPDCSFEEYNGICSAIEASQSSTIVEEVSVLAQFKELELSDQCISRFLACGTMNSISVHLSAFLNFCDQVKFEVVHDTAFSEVKSIEAALQSNSLTVRMAQDLCMRLHAALKPETSGDDVSVNTLTSDLHQFENVFCCLGSFSRHIEVWVFLREMDWFGKAGLQRFYREHENVTNVLLGNVSNEHYLNVLSALEPTVRVLSALGGLQAEGSLLQLLKRISGSSDINRWIGGAAKDNLEQVQESLSLIRRWFCEGADDIASLNSVFEAIQANGAYSLSSTSGISLQLGYTSDGMREMTNVDGSELEEFIGQIERIKRNESAEVEAVECLLEQHRMLQAAVSNLMDSDLVGYPIGDLLAFSCRVGEEFLAQACDFLQRSQECKEEKDSWLQASRNKYPISLLFWAEELKEINTMLEVGPSDETVIERLFAMLSRIDPKSTHLSKDSVRELVEQHSSAMENSLEEEGWLVKASSFLERAGRFAGASFQDTSNIEGTLQLHKVSCGIEQERKCILAVLEHVYKDRLPYEFEILDALDGCSEDELGLFLKRSSMFRCNVFCIVNVDKLSGRRIEKLLDFLSDQDIKVPKLQLHCIQSSPTILDASSTVQGKDWDESILNFGPNRWKNLIVDDKRITKVHMVVSEACGAGKTMFIRNELDRLSPDCEVGAITIHERSSVDSLADDVMATFTENVKQKGLHISFMCMPSLEDSAKRKRWFDDINSFFSSLLVKGALRSRVSSRSFQLGACSWILYVELPFNAKSGGSAIESAKDWLHRHVPILAMCCEVIVPESKLIIDEETRRVCTYLRAYEDGTIDRKWKSQKKRVAFVLDSSGSMGASVGSGQTALSAAVDCALQILDSHLNQNDLIGVSLFSNATRTVVPMQEVGDSNHKSYLRKSLHSCRNQVGGGTCMYRALQDTLMDCEQTPDVETWIICLTDGCSGDNDTTFRPLLERSSDNLNVILIGVNLPSSYQSQMALLCNKYRGAAAEPSKGIFISSRASVESLAEAFETAANCIPVSQTFELDGQVSNSECWRLIEKYAPQSIPEGSMQQFSFWVRFIYRRVSILDKNDEFNFNNKFERLGSSLMEIMLMESERILGQDLAFDWINTNYTQLIYDFEDPESPKFRLLCTSPGNLDPEVRQRYDELTLPGFFVPTESELSSQRVLCDYLSQALDIPVGGRDCLACVEKERFVLTLDFALKMLCLEERVACGIPVIMEGETGVSKTALTKMYSKLKNLSNSLRAKELTNVDLKAIEEEAEQRGQSLGMGDSPLARLERSLECAAERSREDKTELSELLYTLLTEKIEQRPAIFQSKPDKFDCGQTRKVLEMLKWFGSSVVEPTFFGINVDSTMRAADFSSLLDPIRQVARKLKGEKSTVIVFFDEINTSSVLGLLKEVVVDRSLNGEPLEANIVAVAACNPVRSSLQRRAWASGHYQVVALPPSMEFLKWCFGSLNAAQEEQFIACRLEMMGRNMVPPALCLAFTRLIAASQRTVRRLAESDLLKGVERDQSRILEAKQRASSVVSLRDIQRVFTLWDFISSKFESLGLTSSSHVMRQRRGMLLAVAIVYFVRLDCAGRYELLSVIRGLPGEELEESLDGVLDVAIEAVLSNTVVPEGIAPTRSLAENCFMTLVCTLSRVPLLIVGLPGTAKTLSVNMLADTACGEDSSNPFFREFARVCLFHYQCSRESTDKEIAAVFQRASQRQQKVDRAKQCCVVFMDEASLPKEERESHKVLHYTLEGDSRVDVGFVAIANHILDAAKSNRCVVLLRPKPNDKEMATIVSGLLFDRACDGTILTREVELGNSIMMADSFALELTSQWTSLAESVFSSSQPSPRSSNGLPVHARAHMMEEAEVETFFGLRDFIYFLKALKSTTTSRTLTRIQIPVESFVQSLERNFSGLGQAKTRKIVSFFLQPFSDSLGLGQNVVDFLRSPMEILCDSLLHNRACLDQKERARFTMIIDSSEDDSIMRLLGMTGLVDPTKGSLFKASHMPEDSSSEKLRLISGVKFAAAQGGLALLSQTESVNESFYDLTNQNFRVVAGRDGVSLFTNIAVGGESRRSKVNPDFECIVHVRSSKVCELPSPFLNRFEKCRLDIKDFLLDALSKLGPGMTGVMQRARMQTLLLLSPLIEEEGLFGWANNDRTLDSIFVDMLPSWSLSHGATAPQFVVGRAESFSSTLAQFVSTMTSLSVEAADLRKICEQALEVLPAEAEGLLKQFVDVTVETGGLIEQALNKLMSVPLDDNLGKLCQGLVQIVITQYAVATLMRLAKPEIVFALQDRLHPDIVQMNLKQPSSLKSLVERELNSLANCPKSKMVVAYTRTDVFNLCMPTLSPNEDPSKLEKAKAEEISTLVSDRVEELVIERLDLLRSEARLRSSLVAWIQQPRKSAYILFVDMKDSMSTERCNYVRMCVEGYLSSAKSKLFVLVLHYSPMASSSWYPALPLGGWSHYFIDGIGQMGPEIGTNGWLSIVCSGQKGANDLHKQLLGFLKQLLPSALLQVGCQQILHPTQIHNVDAEGDMFASQVNALLEVTNRRVGQLTVGDILCSKFAREWLQDGLPKVACAASQGLMQGTTQLSMGASIQSSVSRAFQAYIHWSLCKMNQDQNLSVLTGPNRCSKDVEELFGFVLERLPTVGAGEIFMHQEVSSREPASGKNLLVKARFPFFSMISSCIDECLEMSEMELTENRNSTGTTRVPSDHCTKGLFDTAMNLLGNGTRELADRQIDSHRLDLLANVVKLVQEACPTGCDSDVFQLYMEHFVKHTTGCEATEVALEWLREELLKVGAKRNLVGLHCVLRANETRVFFLRFTSWSAALATKQGNLDRTQLIQSIRAQDRSVSMQLVTIMLKHFEETLPSILEPDSTWSIQLSSFLSQVVTGLVDQSILSLGDTGARIRILVGFLVFTRVPVSEDMLRSSLAQWYDDENKVFREEAKKISLSDFLACIGGHQKTRESLLWGNFCPDLMKAMPDYLDQDLCALAGIINDGDMPSKESHFSSSLLQRACSNSGGTDWFGLSKPALTRISSLLQCKKLREFTETGVRVSVPHFIPSWLLASSSESLHHGSARLISDDEMYYPEFFSSYEHCFDGNFSVVVFDMILRIQLKAAGKMPSSDLLQLLMKGIELETTVDPTKPEDQLAGSALSALALDSQMLCFVAKVAQELVEHGEAAALTSTHAQIGVSMLDQIMHLPHTRYKSFFLAMIKHRSGANSLASLAAPGGQLNMFPWCQELATRDEVADFELPTLQFFIQQEPDIQPLAPAAIVMKSGDTSVSQTRYIQILLDGSSLLEELSLLPDLIEFYLWVHDTFKHQVTRKDARSSIIGDLMTRDNLLKRFEKMHALCLAGLWERLSRKMDKSLQTSKLSWNCNEFAFTTLNDATVMELVSGGHLDELGNDFLFRVIRSIIVKYNALVTRVHELQDEEGERTRESEFILPNTILTGCVGSIAVNLLPLLPMPELELIASASWHNGTKTFNLESFESLLALSSTYTDRPRCILDPVTHLRERFFFHGDRYHEKRSNELELVLADSGIFYAREQDFQLVRKAKETLDQLGMVARDKGVEGLLKMKFQSLDSHRAVSSMLTALCALFEILASKGSCQFFCLAEALARVRLTAVDTTKLPEKLGFPELDSAQWKFLRALNREQIAELVHYLCYQLATEGYLFANCTLSATETISEIRQSIIRERIDRLFATHRRQTTDLLSQFTRKVLESNKDMICKEACQSSSPLGAFLVKAGLCDAVDPILRCLPHDITVRNYVSLLQLLQQAGLSLFLRLAQDEEDSISEDVDSPVPTQKHGWLWTGADSLDESLATTEENSEDGEYGFNLSFNLEDAAREQEHEANSDGTVHSLVDQGATNSEETELSAMVIQRWWRRCCLKHENDLLRGPLVSNKGDFLHHSASGEYNEEDESHFDEESRDQKGLPEEKDASAHELEEEELDGKELADGDAMIKLFVFLVILAAFAAVLYSVLFGSPGLGIRTFS